MTDQTIGTRHQAGSSPSQGEKTATAGQSLPDQARSAGRDLKNKAMDLAGSSSDAIKDQASEFIDAAKDVASQATDKFKQTVDSQKSAGADYVGSLAETIRRAAREFDGDLPIAGTYIRKAASQVEGVADTIRTGNFSDLLQGAQSFARRQPTALLGMAVLAGFGVVRFLKSSADHSQLDRSQHTGGPNFGETAAYQPHRGYRDEFTR
jgi:hypothetical protein